jgi:hypothetical protein
MKKFVLLAVVLVAIAGAVDADAADNQLRAGGGLVFDGTVWGGGAAFDIGIGDRPLAITPFLEYYSKSGLTLMNFGADITYVTGVADGKADVYLGVGAGMVRSSVDNSTLDSGSALLVDVRGGLNYGITESVGIYGEVKYMWADKDGTATKVGVDLSDVGALVGISFTLGQ